MPIFTLLSQYAVNMASVNAFYSHIVEHSSSSSSFIHHYSNFIDDEYWTYCRQGTSDFFKTDEHLKSFLESIPKSTQKYIFTNANEKEAIECLECLGIKEYFLHVYG